MQAFLSSVQKCIEFFQKEPHDCTLISALKQLECRRCPHCGIAIEKTEGCAHVMCTKCMYQFCWCVKISFFALTFCRRWCGNHWDFHRFHYGLRHVRGDNAWDDATFAWNVWKIRSMRWKQFRIDCSESYNNWRNDLLEYEPSPDVICGGFLVVGFSLGLAWGRFVYK